MRIYRTALAAVFGSLFAIAAAAQTTPHMFTGGQQRPDVMRKVADEYQKKNPNVKIEVGGATSKAHRSAVRSRTG